MPRKLRLTPLQRDLLWMLEEAGEETMLTIRITLKISDLEVLDTAIAALAHMSYVKVSVVDSHESMVLTKEGRQSLTV